MLGADTLIPTDEDTVDLSELLAAAADSQEPDKDVTALNQHHEDRRSRGQAND
jgi:hypothetical protein